MEILFCADQRGYEIVLYLLVGMNTALFLYLLYRLYR